MGTCSWTRTVTNKSKKSGKWEVSVAGVGFDTEVSIDEISGGKGKKSKRRWYKESKKDKKYKKKGKGKKGKKDKKTELKLKKGESATITVTATNYSSDEGWQFGTLVLDPKGKSGPELSMPMAVFASKASNPNLFTKTVDVDSASAGDTLTYELNVTNGPVTGPITVTDTLPSGAAFISGSESASVTAGSTLSPWTYDAASNSISWTGELDPGGLEVAPNFTVTGYIPLAALGVAPTAFPTNCDDGGTIFNVPSFTYNGQSYTQVIWSVNGTLEAGTDSGVASSFANQDFPDEEIPNNVLAPYWRDINGCDGGSWSVGVLNSGPFQWTVFEWTDIPHFGSTDAVSFQVWLLNDGSPVGVLPQAHFTYGRLDNVNDGTVGAENASGTDGSTMYFDGAGTPPSVGVDVHVNTLQGGTATLGFQVQVDCSDDLIINQALLEHEAGSEGAIAVTSCD